MKRFIILLSFLFLANLSFAVELWNGFMAGMSEEEAMTRAGEVLNLRSQRIVNAKVRLGLPSVFSNGYRVPEAEKIYYLNSGNDGLYRVPNSGSYIYNVALGFYNNRLFAIRIIWEAQARDLLALAIQRYGQPTIFRYVHGIREPEIMEIQMWRLQGRDFFIDRETFHPELDRRIFVFIDQSIQQNYQTEYELAERRRQAEEDARRRSAVDNVTF